MKVASARMAGEQFADELIATANSIASPGKGIIVELFIE